VVLGWPVEEEEEEDEDEDEEEDEEEEEEGGGYARWRGDQTSGTGFRIQTKSWSSGEVE
jgi:hypothetical protein